MQDYVPIDYIELFVCLIYFLNLFILLSCWNTWVCTSCLVLSRVEAETLQDSKGWILWCVFHRSWEWRSRCVVSQSGQGQAPAIVLVSGDRGWSCQSRSVSRGQQPGCLRGWPTSSCHPTFPTPFLPDFSPSRGRLTIDSRVCVELWECTVVWAFVCVRVRVCVQFTNGFHMHAHAMSRTCLMLVTSRFSGRSSRALTLLSALCEAENASHPFEKYFQDDGAYSIQYYYLLVRWKFIRTNKCHKQPDILREK